MADDIGSPLLVYLTVYLCVALFVLAVFGGVGKYLGMQALRKVQTMGEVIDRHTHGVFASGRWPGFMRGPLSMLVVLFGFMPVAVILICFSAGLILAPLEGWSVKEGILYVLTSALGLLHSLESVNSPEDTPGKIADAIISVWVMLLAATAMGIVAGLSLVVDMTDAMPSTFCALLRYVFLYIPALIFACSFLSGCLLSAAEGWAVDDGFWYMLSAVCGLDEPLLDKFPETAFGVFLEVLFICVELGFAGAIIGIVGAHPLVSDMIVQIEGDRVDKKFMDSIDAVRDMVDSHTLSPEALEKTLDFCKVMRTQGLLPAAPSMEELKHAFALLDKDGNGKLNIEEMRNAIADLGCSADVADGLLEKLDTNKDGSVSYDEFAKRDSFAIAVATKAPPKASPKVMPVHECELLPGVVTVEES